MHKTAIIEKTDDGYLIKILYPGSHYQTWVEVDEIKISDEAKEREGKMKCNTCGHYSLYKMISSGQPFGYSGDIPCLRCIHYGKNDEYTGNSNDSRKSAFTNTDEMREKINNET